MSFVGDKGIPTTVPCAGGVGQQGFRGQMLVSLRAIAIVATHWNPHAPKSFCGYGYARVSAGRCRCLRKPVGQDPTGKLGMPYL